jgi:hypothetical protein
MALIEIEALNKISNYVEMLFVNVVNPIIALVFVALFIAVQYFLIKFYIFLGKNIFIGITNLINWYSGNQKVQGIVGTIRDLVEE